MSMTPSDNWYSNNVDKIIEMVADSETMEFSQVDFDRIERELFSLSYDLIFKKLQAAEEEIKELQEQGVVDVAIREKLLHENKILREAVEKYRKELRLCYSEDHKDFYPKEIDIELDKALEKVGGGE